MAGAAALQRTGLTPRTSLSSGPRNVDSGRQYGLFKGGFSVERQDEAKKARRKRKLMGRINSQIKTFQRMVIGDEEEETETETEDGEGGEPRDHRISSFNSTKLPMSVFDPSWIFEMMQKHVDDTEIFVHGSQILSNWDRVVSANKFIPTISADSFEWAIGYTGPNWDSIHSFLFGVHDSSTDSKRLQRLVQASIQNVAYLEKNPSQTWFNERKYQTVNDAIWMYLYSTDTFPDYADDLKFKWDTEDGLFALVWGFSCYQQYPRAHPILYIFDIFKNIVLLEESKNFAQRYWKCKEFLKVFKPFLRNLTDSMKEISWPELDDGDEVDQEHAQNSRLYVVSECVWMMAELARVKEFCKIFRKMSFLQGIIASLDELEDSPDWKDNEGLESLSLRMVLFCFCVLSSVQDVEYTNQSLVTLRSHLVKCTPHYFLGVSESEFVLWSRLSPQLIAEGMKVKSSYGCCNDLEKAKRATLSICTYLEKSMQRRVKADQVSRKQSKSVPRLSASNVSN